MSLKPIVILLLCFYSTSFLFSQKKVKQIKINSNPFSIVTKFKCERIIDNRLIKDNIGYIRKGTDNSKVIAQLKGDFKSTLKDLINTSMLSPSDDAEQLVFIIHQFNIAERIGNLTKNGRARVEIEFARSHNSELYSLGRFKADINKQGLNVTSSHKQQLNLCLNICIDAFRFSEWESKDGVLIDMNKATSLQYDFTQYPTKGVYTSYTNLVRNIPLKKYEFSLNHLDGFSKLSRYEYVAVKDNIKLIDFISDGENFYIHASIFTYANHFVKAMYYGRYIYLEDRFSDGDATIAFGLVGSLASSKRVSMIYDPLKNNLFYLNDKTLYNLIKDYPDILKKYIKSNRKREDRLEALLLLNAKFEK